MKLVLLSLVSVFSVSALANDGGVVGVKVEDLKIEKVEYGKKEFRTPVEMGNGEAIEMSFKGGDVAELMKWIPGGRSVTRKYSKHVRTIAIAAKEGYLYINCSNADLSSDKNGRDVWTPKEPSCTVTMNKYTKPMTDEWTELFGDWEDLDVPNSCKMK